MAAAISHKERLERCLSGEKTDRTPVALWRHFPVDDQTPHGLAKATAEFQRLYDFDLIKVTPSSSFCLKDWGVDDRWRGEPEGTRTYEKFIINTPEDWTNIKPLNPLKGHLGQQIECLKLLDSQFSPHTPLLQTIFSPLAQAKNLARQDRLLVHMRQYPQAVHAGLKIITQSTIAFLEEAAKTGIAGIFYAVQHAQFGLLSRMEFEEFGRRYDLQVLQAAGQLWLNMLHLHGEQVMFNQVLDYPVQILNWHDRHTYPSLAEARRLYSGVLCGGLRRQETMVLGNPEQVVAEGSEAIAVTQGTKFILGTGCVLPITAPTGNIHAARKVVEG